MCNFVLIFCNVHHRTLALFALWVTLCEHLNNRSPRD